MPRLWLLLSVAFVATLWPGTSVQSAIGPETAPCTSVDNWTTYAHDQQRTGLSCTPYTPSTIHNLKIAWATSIGHAVSASPIVYGGVVVVQAVDGYIFAMSTTTGAIVWQDDIGGQVLSTPTMSDGMMFNGNRFFTASAGDPYTPAPSGLYAWDMFGERQWQVGIPGILRSSPIVAQGRVFVGIAGGDPPSCLHVGVEALNEQTGSRVWNWYVDPHASRGGAVWSAGAYDGTQLLFGTGNTCEGPISTANTMVSLSPLSGALNWATNLQVNSLSDDDFGGGQLITGGRVYSIGKNGYFYAVDEVTGRMYWRRWLGAADGAGGYGTPTTDGTGRIVVSGGDYSAGAAQAARHRSFAHYRPRTTVASTYGGRLWELDLNGVVKWSRTTRNPILSYAAIAGGMVFAPMDNTLKVLSLTTRLPDVVVCASRTDRWWPGGCAEWGLRRRYRRSRRCL